MTGWFFRLNSLLEEEIAFIIADSELSDIAIHFFYSFDKFLLHYVYTHICLKWSQEEIFYQCGQKYLQARHMKEETNKQQINNV